VGDVDDPGTEPGGDLTGAIRAAVVGHDDLPVEPGPSKGALGLLDA
jgi:hypothetical protein